MLGKDRIVTYGFTEEQNARIAASFGECRLQSVKSVTQMLAEDAVLYIIDSAVTVKEDVLLLEKFYAEVGFYAKEHIILIGNKPEFGGFTTFDSVDCLIPNLAGILQNAQCQYELCSMYCAEYALLPARAIGDYLKDEIRTAFQRKYGNHPNEQVRNRLQSEMTAMEELAPFSFAELATVFELGIWLKKRGYRYYMSGSAASGFITFLLGLTQVNPLPEQYGGYDLVWQEYCSYGRLPTYVLHLPKSLRTIIIEWQQTHWMKALYPKEWQSVQSNEKDCLICGNVCFYFDAEKATAPELPSLCREDIYHYLKKHGFADKEAFRGMCSVRKGRGVPVITEEMRTAEDSYLINRCEHIDKLPSRAELLERQLFVLQPK